MSNFNKLTKVCGSCKTRKSVSEFCKDQNTRDKLSCYCKRCSHQKQLKKYDSWTAEQKEKNNAATRKWQKKYPEKNKNSQLKFYYGITLEQHNQLFEQQKGCCVICGRHQSELKRPLSIDHNHITKKIRGLVCQRCNALLGMADVDNLKTLLLQKAMEYVEKRDK